MATPTKPKTIAEMFDDYAAFMHLSEAGPNEQAGTRLAFYAGAYALLNEFVSTVADLSEEDGVTAIKDYRDEVESLVTSQQRKGPSKN